GDFSLPELPEAIDFYDKLFILKWQVGKHYKPDLPAADYMKFRLNEVSNYLSDKPREAMISYLFQDQLPFEYDHHQPSDYPQLDSVFKTLKEFLNNESITKKVSAKVERIKTIRTTLSQNAEAINFTVFDSSGKKVRLSDFKNKAVYIDVWASWCTPCLAQFSKFKEFENRFEKDSNIVFLSISMDDVKMGEAFKLIKKHNPGGMQLWVGDKGFESDFAKRYYIETLPRYIQINKNGTFASAFADTPNRILARLESAATN
ncbi:MAG: TlpA disulfide reductase family protein, partial [Flavitalea sp.]